MPFQAEQAKTQFPIFQHNEQTLLLSYLDNAATSQKPFSVLQAMDTAARMYNAPVNRGFYPLAEQANDLYENSRARVMQFIGAKHLASTIFTGSATESINLVAQGFLRPRLHAGLTVWVTRMEHHANFLTWQQVCKQTGAALRIIELNDKGELDIKNAAGLFGKQTALIALAYTSNVLGTTNNVQEICAQAKQYNIPVLVDAAQALVSNKVDVQTMGCDFLVSSAHKMFGPNGIGLLYIKPEQLPNVNPTKLGGGMVDFVGDDYTNTQFTEAPYKFEAGSPNLSGAAGFAAACKFIDELGQNVIKAHIKNLATLLYKGLSDYEKVIIVTPKQHLSSGIVSFYHTQIHAHDLAQIMGDNNVAVRAGHHCAQPLLTFLQVAATVRISISIYNTENDIQKALIAIANAQEVFA